MIVTDKKYYLEPKLVDKLNLMIKRTSGIHKFDNLVLVDGKEGYGKSNIAVGICYYFAQMTKRVYDNSRVFFDLDKLMEFAMKTEKQVLHWDEGALGGLATEWWAKNQSRFRKFLMVARKKQHFIVICIPSFFKLNEYFVFDRSIALIHCYAKNETELGRFCYFTKRKKEKLYYDWKKKKLRNYLKYKSFHGKFGLYLNKVLDEKSYEIEKDNAILSLGDNEVVNLISFRKQISKDAMINLEKEGVKLTQPQLSRTFGVAVRTIAEYTKEIRDLRMKETNKQILSG